MKNILYIFDLKNTLVADNLELLIDPAMLNTLRATGKLMLYSITEPWTFAVLKKFDELFSEFSSILLVKDKVESDLQDLKALYKTIVVIGDGEESEIAIATALGYRAALVDQKSNPTSSVISDLLRIQL